jgi:hypothetical protein
MHGRWKRETSKRFEDSKHVGFLQVEEGTCIADDPPQRAASLSPSAQRMSSR